MCKGALPLYLLLVQVQDFLSPLHSTGWWNAVFASIGNLRGFNMTAPALQQFFPQATRHSLLGPPPVGVSLKPTRLGFPSLPFQRQNRTFRKVGLCFPAAGELCAPSTLAAVDCIVGGVQRRRERALQRKECFVPCCWHRNAEIIPSQRLLHLFTFMMQRFLATTCPRERIPCDRTV